MSYGTGDTKLLALIDSGALLNFMSSLVARHLGWAIRPNNTLVAVRLANGTVGHKLGIATGLVLSGAWQAYMIFFVLAL